MEPVELYTRRRRALGRATHLDDPGQDEDAAYATLYPPRSAKAPGCSSAILAIEPSAPETDQGFDEAIGLPVQVIPLGERRA